MHLLKYVNFQNINKTDIFYVIFTNITLVYANFKDQNLRMVFFYMYMVFYNVGRYFKICINEKNDVIKKHKGKILHLILITIRKA